MTQNPRWLRLPGMSYLIFFLAFKAIRRSMPGTFGGRLSEEEGRDSMMPGWLFPEERWPMKTKCAREFPWTCSGPPRRRKWFDFLGSCGSGEPEKRGAEWLNRRPAGSSTGETGGQNVGRREAGERPCARLAKYLI